MDHFPDYTSQYSVPCAILLLLPASEKEVLPLFGILGLLRGVCVPGIAAPLE